MANILGVGNTTLDIIHSVASYPKEDDEVRAISKARRSGGNCLNTLTVLKQLGHHCVFMGTLANDIDGVYLQQQIKTQEINVDYCPIIAGKTPTSYILSSEDTGARTIVHYRDLDLPELSFEDFNHINLSQFDWLHFEGRNLPEISKMISFTRKEFSTLPCSIEIEKPRENIESLFSQADVLFFSQHYINHLGYKHPKNFLNTLQEKIPHIDKICPWGEQGAYSMFSNGEFFHEPAYAPRQVVDTLGAGDTFNAGYIHACLNKYSFPKRLHFACQIAGKKCEQEGLHNLINIV
ncbi:PfkB family carbohydrate kinase [Candidatus Nitrosacidococcus sp. I8]|uniref:PfkB family carbohydrate kinase n=1 Tax=Candidatus Nitrosacidococcus sp. I8 TaxID=2942908 RepID=UPI002226F585|nr:PfkB family carbohydrate kinase [Candidatus Nitrosacidococcus sp. I8]CAH9019301.1 putative sugar kinase YdjH [Candidatus Nitrosacidococcus sp. I8]